MTRRAFMQDPSQPMDQILLDLVKRIVDAAHPLRIILFGSAAKGSMGPQSDLDLLVIMPEGTHRRRTAQRLYRLLQGIGMPKDVVVVTEKDIHDHGENPSLILYPALREGKELYHATG